VVLASALQAIQILYRKGLTRVYLRNRLIAKSAQPYKKGWVFKLKMSSTQTKTIKLSLPTITFTLPTVPVKFKKLPNQIIAMAQNFYDDVSSTTKKFSFEKLLSSWNKFPQPKKRGLLIFLIIAVILVGVVSGAKNLNAKSKVSGVSVSGVDINRSFEFPLIKTKKADENTLKIKYTITKVEKTKTIVIKGQTATSVAGRTFLIVNLKLENPSNNSISIKTRDFIRLLPEGSQDRLAPDIHNDPTEIQAISTKITRVGFPVDDNTKNFKLFVGEIEGNKEEISINF